MQQQHDPSNNRIRIPLRRARTGRRLAAVVAGGALLLAACGSDEPLSLADEGTQTTATDMKGAFGPGCDSVPTEGLGSFAGMAEDPAATAASNNPLLSTLVTAVTEAGLVDTLNGDGPFTIFAPTNDAFDALPDEVLEAVLADPDLLTTVLTYHVIPGQSLTAADLGQVGSSTTVEGSELTFGAEGTMVDQADVVCSDVPVANGTVHIVDQVLLAPAAVDAIDAMSEPMDDGAMDDGAMDDGAMDDGGSMDDGAMDDGAMDDAMDDGAMDDDGSMDAMTDDVMLGATGPACAAVPSDGLGSFAGMAEDPAATAASNNPLLSTLVTAVTEAGLVDTLNGDGPFTIFAPTNDAFGALPAADLEAVLADPDLLTDVLTLHVIAGERLSSDELIAAGSFTTVNGAKLSFEAEGDAVLVNGSATTICSDVPTANATVHIIDAVLLP